MIKHDEEYYRQRKPQPDLGAINNFKRFLWHPERRAFLDRTAQEWGSVGLFYLCFYGVLFSIFALQMWMTYKYVTAFEKPLFQYNRVATRAWLEPNPRTMFRMTNLHGPESFIQNEGIVLKPFVSNSKPPMILIDESHEMGRVDKYVDTIKDTLAGYQVDRSKFDPKCNDRVLREDSKTSCFFDIRELGKCSQAPYGYTSSPQPCAYIMFNKRFGWLPIFYSQASMLPNDMPTWLQTVIRKSEQFHVWLSCEGKSEEDRQNVGEIEYLPRPGFPVQFFPFAGQPDYLAPIVALRFKNLTVNQLVSIECKTWARNIDNENRYNLNFRLLVKDPRAADSKKSDF
ncbi:hypothetical protein TSAR_004511 [Trichomalopsis sarcophagae]|uniref:Sodium/potassium-transporting ATPase subunit beta n=1 Tax=Trichomalopsis sarcophagae TaxID=543379 RepID=A0A232EZS4_9HYME|nr:hypothetical protein TSAR_004511 [Trichomalopsis sarcophagae]